MRGDSNQGEDPRTGRRRLSVSGEHLGGVTLEGTGLGDGSWSDLWRGVPGLTNFQFRPGRPLAKPRPAGRWASAGLPHCGQSESPATMIINSWRRSQGVGNVASVMSPRRSLSASLAGLALWVASAVVAPAAPAHGPGAQALGGSAVGRDAPASGDHSKGSCRHGDRGRVLGVDRVASHPTAADARALLRLVGRLLPGLLQLPLRTRGRHRLRVRHLQGHVLHGRCAAYGPAAGGANGCHREPFRAATVRADVHRRVSARYVGRVLRRTVEPRRLR